jgi:hypothetical protein
LYFLPEPQGQGELRGTLPQLEGGPGLLAATTGRDGAAAGLDGPAAGTGRAWSVPVAWSA